MKSIFNFLIAFFLLTIVYAQDTKVVSVPGDNPKPVKDTSHYKLLKGFIEDQQFFIELNPQSGIPYMQIAIYKMRMGKLEAAIKDFKKSLTLESDSNLVANVHSWMGGIYDRLNQYENAAQSFTKGILIGEKFPYPLQTLGVPELDMEIDIAFQYYNRGVIYNRLKELKKAEADFKTSIKLNSYSYLPYFGLGLTYEYQKKYDTAIKYYQEALMKNPEHFRSYNNLGHIYNEKKEYPLAIQMLEKALNLNPNYPSALRNLAETKKGLGDNKGACELATKFNDFYIKQVEAKDRKKEEILDLTKYCH